MNISTIGYLSCPICKQELNPINTFKNNKGNISSGKLKCSNDHEFPIVLERPILLTKNHFDKWVAPIDEALGIDDEKIPPLSLPRLKDIGIENAINMVKKNTIVLNNKKSYSHNNDYSDIITNQLVNKAKYRKSGKWFTRGNKGRLLSNSKLDKNNNQTKSAILFRDSVTKLNPKSVIDLASGIGNGVSWIVNEYEEFDKVISVERDIPCTWSIQYRLENINNSNNIDVIAGDVRNLPIKSGSFDVATTMASQIEIHGIKQFLKEVHRVLKKDGSYVTVYAYDPPLFGLMGKKEYRRFAQVADLYSGYEDFVKLCADIGLKEVRTTFIEHPNRKECVSIFKKC